MRQAYAVRPSNLWIYPPAPSGRFAKTMLYKKCELC